MVAKIPDLKKVKMNGLRAKRLAAGLSLRQLSEKSGVAIETLSRLERGHNRPQARTINKLAKALDVDRAELTAPAAVPTPPRKGEKPMNRSTIEVPAFYPDPKNPDLYKRWDGSEEAWMWKSAIDFRDYAKISAAAYFYAYTQDWSSVPSLLTAAGWEFGYCADEAVNDAAKFVEANQEEIESRARAL
jgi:transcriptional regulator with XRE-family HTH domain